LGHDRPRVCDRVPRHHVRADHHPRRGVAAPHRIVASRRARDDDTVTDRVERACPAKVNLVLRVLAREADGMHTLETVFCGIALTVDGAECGPADENLAWRAADAVLAQTGRRFGVRIHLTKRIPVGAGLGGGSSDAAQVLLAVNELAGDAVPRAELLHAGARLGADVPFLMSDAPLALAWGHGTRLLALAPLPPRPMLL